jgi:hypothetical protein
MWKSAATSKAGRPRSVPTLCRRPAGQTEAAGGRHSAADLSRSNDAPDTGLGLTAGCPVTRPAHQALKPARLAQRPNGPAQRPTHPTPELARPVPGTDGPAVGPGHPAPRPVSAVSSWLSPAEGKAARVSRGWQAPPPTDDRWLTPAALPAICSSPPSLDQHHPPEQRKHRPAHSPGSRHHPEPQHRPAPCSATQHDLVQQRGPGSRQDRSPASHPGRTHHPAAAPSPARELLPLRDAPHPPSAAHRPPTPKAEC